MKVRVDQLDKILKKEIMSLYFVSGNEWFLVQDACNIIRKAAISFGYKEQKIFYVESGFNWEYFLNSIDNTSLFNNLSLIELHLKDKLTSTGSKIIQRYAEHQPANKILLIIAPRIDSAQQKTAWFKAINVYGCCLFIWPLKEKQILPWIANRMLHAGLKTDHRGLKLLADNTSGNLLATNQEIEKITILYGKGQITAEQIEKILTDNTHYNIYNLLDAITNNIPFLINKILIKLRNEHTDPALILWTITNELRSSIKLSYTIKQGVNTEEAFIQHNIESKRKPLIKKILSKYNLGQLENLLKRVFDIDLMIKGANTQNLPWHEIEWIYLDLSRS
ncbi:MAG: DNA polymerase III subunit delta [Coxiellaceae bacterium]|jgi:DNA polymerase-3 subunit delta|nr:DNA polymerase III subunit delta [Coxiellaceae bacterium]